jgi:hypothetical protein
MNVQYKDFISERALSRYLLPVATFNREGEVINDEFVAMIEGVS